MPVLRYFVFVGSALLALLLITNAYLPKVTDEVRADSDFDRSTIRIHSQRKWPERVVFDTNQPTIIPPQPATTIAAIEPPKVADVSAKAREAFAEMSSPDRAQAHPSDLKKPGKIVQRKRKIAKRRVAPPVMMVAQQPQFSFFGNSMW